MATNRWLQPEKRQVLAKCTQWAHFRTYSW